MYCLKCGRDTKENNVFCDSCQSAMDLYPVRPGTAIHLPRRQAPIAPKKASHRKRATPPEEQIASLRKSLRRTRICIAVLVLVLSLSTALLLQEVLSNDGPVIGQNYTIDTTMGED